MNREEKRAGLTQISVPQSDSSEASASASSERQFVYTRVTLITLVAVVGSVAITIGLAMSLTGHYPDPVGIFIAILAPLIIAPCASYMMVSLAYRLQIANKRLKALRETDPLTNTLNRRKFMEIAERELALAERHCYPTSVVLVDFDDFKQVNDKHGHAAGDQALIHTIGVMKALIRESDILARFGGEEFILLLPHTAREGAQSLTQRILDQVAASRVPFEDIELTITLSAGIVTCETSRTPLDVLMCRADELLYASKQSGRNCATAETIVNIVPQYQRA